MAKFVRTFSKRILIISNGLLAIIFLIACLNPWLSPERWWLTAVTGLAFPFLLLMIIGFALVWIFFRSRWVFLNIICLILAFTNIRALFGFHFFSGFKNEKDSGSIRIMTWNVNWFEYQRSSSGAHADNRKKILDFIATQDADILCFQEFLARDLRGKAWNSVAEIQALGYPYYYRNGDYIRKDGINQVGPAIFSRYPITNTVLAQYKGSVRDRAAESLIAVDLDINGRMLRVFTTHLQSILLQKNDYRSLDIIRNGDDSLVEASRSILRKLKTGYRFRASQAEMVRDFLDQSPYPEVICGDFNDVPNSYVYFTIKGNRQDAFIEAGAGLGRTFTNLSPTLRIDYIMPGNKLKVVQAKREVLPYSDHFPVLADLRWRE